MRWWGASWRMVSGKAESKAAVSILVSRLLYASSTASCRNSYWPCSSNASPVNALVDHKNTWRFDSQDSTASQAVRFLPFRRLLLYYLSVSRLKKVLALKICILLLYFRIKISVLFNFVCVVRGWRRGYGVGYSEYAPV